MSTILTIVNEGEESLLHEEMGIEHDQFRARRYQIVTFVEFEEFYEYLRLVLL